MPTYHHNRIHYLLILVFVVLSVILLLLTVAPYTVRADWRCVKDPNVSAPTQNSCDTQCGGVGSCGAWLYNGKYYSSAFLCEQAKGSVCSVDEFVSDFPETAIIDPPASPPPPPSSVVPPPPPDTSPPTVPPSTPPATGNTIPNPLGVASFAELVANLANAVTKIAIPFVVVFLVYAGFLFVTARGDVKQLETAKKTFYWTIVGAAVVVGAAALANAAVDFVKSIGVP